MSYIHIQRLATTRYEYEATRAAIACLEQNWPTLMHGPQVVGIRFIHVRLSARNLEDTYVIRLFAQFEGLLQSHLSAIQPRRRLPRTAEGLINRTALLHRLPDPIREGAHAVRAYRNSIVHPGVPSAPPLGFPQTLAALNRFLAPLPDSP